MLLLNTRVQVNKIICCIILCLLFSSCSNPTNFRSKHEQDEGAYEKIKANPTKDTIQFNSIVSKTVQIVCNDSSTYLKEGMYYPYDNQVICGVLGRYLYFIAEVEAKEKGITKYVETYYEIIKYDNQKRKKVKSIPLKNFFISNAEYKHWQEQLNSSWPPYPEIMPAHPFFIVTLYLSDYRFLIFNENLDLKAQYDILELYDMTDLYLSRYGSMIPFYSAYVPGSELKGKPSLSINSHMGFYYTYSNVLIPIDYSSPLFEASDYKNMYYFSDIGNGKLYRYKKDFEENTVQLFPIYGDTSSILVNANYIEAPYNDWLYSKESHSRICRTHLVNHQIQCLELIHDLGKINKVVPIDDGVFITFDNYEAKCFGKGMRFKIIKWN